MYVEWWMGLVFLAWWVISIHQLTKDIRKSSFEKGVSQGTESTLKILQREGIISINENDEIISKMRN